MGDVTGSGDIGIRKLGSGEHLVVVSKLFARDAMPSDDDVRVLVLPANFETACN